MLAEGRGAAGITTGYIVACGCLSPGVCGVADDEADAVADALDPGGEAR
jgi:hypothetical protein